MQVTRQTVTALALATLLFFACFLGLYGLSAAWHPRPSLGEVEGESLPIMSIVLDPVPANPPPAAGARTVILRIDP